VTWKTAAKPADALFETFSVGSVSVFYLYQRNRATEGALAKRRRCNHIAKTWLEWTLGRAYRA
jgi:hypothetical protein